MWPTSSSPSSLAPLMLCRLRSTLDEFEMVAPPGGGKGGAAGGGAAGGAAAASAAQPDEVAPLSPLRDGDGDGDDEAEE